MSKIRLSSGDDIEIKLSVKEALEIFSTLTQPTGFVEVAGTEGPLYFRPQEVIAIFPEQERRDTGFLFTESHTQQGKSKAKQ